MTPSNEAWSNDFEALSRQYWNAWSEMARHAGSGHGQQMPSWKEAMDMWAPWARDGRAQTDETVSRMNQLTGDWFGKMQALATKLSGSQAGAADIAAEWKRALGIENNPFAGMFQSMSGPDAHGFDHLVQQSGPWLDAMKGQWGGMFNMPAFGLMREQQERLQQLMKSQVEYQQAMQGYNAQLMACGQKAFAKFEDKLAERSEPGRQVDSARALFDLWIDAAEEAWAEVALTPEFRTAYGNLVNAQSRMRAGIQDLVERATATVGMPTRTEVNSSHRKVTQLERELRDLKQRLAALESNTGKSAAPAPREERAQPVAAKKAAPKKVSAKSAPRRAAPPARRSK